MVRIPLFVRAPRSQRRGAGGRTASKHQLPPDDSSQRQSSSIASDRTGNVVARSEPHSSTGSPPASLAARQGLIHLRMRGPSKEECVICAQCFGVNDVVTVLPCGHMHHSVCVLEWLQRKCTCPTCRNELPSEEEHHHEESPTTTTDVTTENRTTNDSVCPTRKTTKLILYNPIIGNANGIPNQDQSQDDDVPLCLADVTSFIG
ncbi:ring finger domain containing protein [Nitzschia inconspicua]|uniref:Ring finger domain containing protein n=1 Tax=Nitzschia inconspicua TaxID=303405 RepID=A0A9K3M0X5_9STRA|nr:ring finger domain containing protein [Nitzschia inconspicua]KAG7371694.1 ring finger domain containing protein [Nitzschia inconspicua]